LRKSPLNRELATETILTMETIVIALLALATLGYLVVAVLCPEKF
jgi:hypothetical protein